MEWRDIYIKLTIPNINVRFRRIKYFSDCDREICRYIKRGFPVIALLIKSAKEMHYVNIVAIDPDDQGGANNYIILDTDGRLYKISYENMRDCMKNTIPVGTVLFGMVFAKYELGTYNIVTIENSASKITRYSHFYYNLPTNIVKIILMMIEIAEINNIDTTEILEGLKKYKEKLKKYQENEYIKTFLQKKSLI
ncbi:MAG: hypothetical protein GY830_11190 [Bacteroidetes bacterium]|nr:hypothetical protein [Bacteroidota bacterium]